MIKQIKLRDRSINYTLKISQRARKIRLAISGNDGLVATKPWGISEKNIEKFIREKAGWVLPKLEYFEKNKNSFFRKNDRESYLKHKNRALELARQRAGYYSKIYNLNFNKISIRNQKTRWGSCSKKGNLNFNYKIALLSRDASDYIIIHELCHLIEFNHSLKFWNLVAKTSPNYLDIKKKLRSERL